MSFTPEQKAYHLRKMRTRMFRLDINKDGFISREDYELMGIKLAELSGMTGEQAEAAKKQFLKVADMVNVKPGVKTPLEEAAKKASESLLVTMTAKERSALINDTHNLVFDAIDTNKDGHISLSEFKVYLKIIAPGIEEDKISHSFSTIDSDKNGEISREEFLAAANDFLQGVEETEVSKVFFGPLLD
jgi:Ca2+-binding EF-hand superfamily protein